MHCRRVRKAWWLRSTWATCTRLRVPPCGGTTSRHQHASTATRSSLCLQPASLQAKKRLCMRFLRVRAFAQTRARAPMQRQETAPLRTTVQLRVLAGRCCSGHQLPHDSSASGVVATMRIRGLTFPRSQSGDTTRAYCLTQVASSTSLSSTAPTRVCGATMHLGRGMRSLRSTHPWRGFLVCRRLRPGLNGCKWTWAEADMSAAW